VKSVPGWIQSQYKGIGGRS